MGKQRSGACASGEIWFAAAVSGLLVRVARHWNGSAYSTIHTGTPSYERATTAKVRAAAARTGAALFMLARALGGGGGTGATGTYPRGLDPQKGVASQCESPHKSRKSRPAFGIPRDCLQYRFLR